MNKYLKTLLSSLVIIFIITTVSYIYIEDSIISGVVLSSIFIVIHLALVRTLLFKDPAEAVPSLLGAIIWDVLFAPLKSLVKSKKSENVAWVILTLGISGIAIILMIISK